MARPLRRVFRKRRLARRSRPSTSVSSTTNYSAGVSWRTHRPNNSSANNYGSGRMINLATVNKSPIPRYRNVTFKWSSYVNLSSAADVSNSTSYISTRSIYDPNYAIVNTVFTNTACPWYTELMGTNPGQYRKYRVKYLDVTLKLRNVTQGTSPIVVLGATVVGTTDYAATVFINNLAARVGHIGKIMSWNEGQDSDWATWKVRVYPWQIMGITKAQYNDVDYITPYNESSSAAPWLTLSIGDSLVDGAGAAAQKVQGNIFIDYHTKIMDSGLSPSEGV